ncbi:hypothetical protein pb186bvf_016615 [Paramecium bursaria]
MSLQKFTQQLKDAYLEQDKVKSQEALLQFYKVTNFNLDLALKLCSQIITNMEVGQNLREAAVQQLINYMKHSVINRSKPYKQAPLRLLPHNIQNYIRIRCQELFSDVGLIETMKICAQIIKDIPSQEINPQIWDQVVSFLIQHLGQDNPKINQYTVIYISERLKDLSINVHELQILFQRTYQSLSREKLKDYIIESLKSSLEYISSCNEEIINYVKGLIFNQIVSKNMEIRSIALQTVIHFNRLPFKHLPLYIFDLFKITISYFKSYPQLAMLAIQIWLEIGQDISKEAQTPLQLIIKQNVIRFFSDKCDVFLRPLLENLLITDGDYKQGDEIPDVSRQGQSYKLISYILDVSDKAGHQTVLNFITYHIKMQLVQHQEHQLRKKESESVRKILFDIVDKFVDLLKEPNLNTVISALNALSLVAQNYPETLLYNVRSQEIIQLIVSILQYSPEYLMMPLNIIRDLTQCIENYQESYIFKNRHFVLQSIAKVVIRPDVVGSQDVNIVDRVFEIMINVIFSIHDKVILKAYLCQFMIQINQTLNVEQDCYIIELQSGLTSCIHGCLQKLDITDVNDQETYEIIQVCQSGKLAKKSDLFYVYAGLAQCQKNKFKKYVEICLMDISAGLQNIQDLEGFKGALNCLSDVAKALMKEFKPYIRVIVYLKSLVMNPEFDKELKSWIFDTIGFIASSTNQECHIYMNELKTILHQGIADCLKLHQDQNDVSNAQRMKEILIGYYYSLLQTFDNYQHNPHPELEDTVFPVFRFIRTVCDKKHKNEISFIRDCVNLIIDLACAYESNQKLNPIIKPFITNEFFLNLIRVLSKVEDDYIQESVVTACDILEEKYNFKLKL